METNWNQLIERYLNNELSAEGKAGFETELAKNPELKEEFELHQLTQNIIKRASTRNLVQQSAKRYHFKKMVTNAGIVVLIIAVIATAAILFTNTNSNPKNPASEKQELIEQSLLDEMSTDLQFENIDPQYFKFTGADDVFLSESGVLLSITDNSFLLNGKAYQGEAVVQWQEAQKASEIIKAGLSTMSGNKLLETQGMFSLNAFTPDGKQLELSKTGIYVQVPVNELKKDMMLFNGVKGKNGAIDWQEPVALERLPKPKSMAKMDLFPPKYEPKLNELKWFTSKAKRDSLYLSFDETLITNDTLDVQSADPVDLFNDIPQPFKQTSRGKDLDLGGVSQISMMSLPQIQDNQYQVSAATSQQSERAEDKVKWAFRLEKTSETEATIIARVTVAKDWRIGSVNRFGTWLPTKITLAPSSEYSLVGSLIESTPNQELDPAQGVVITFQSGKFEIRQKIRMQKKDLSNISVSYTYAACKINAHCLPPVKGTSIIYLNPNKNAQPETHIPPSKVLAIWNKKFDNTILATQDFEDRMKVIHNTCDEKVFDVYVNSLNEPLWKLDERVVKMGYPEFRKFADQKVGSLKLKEDHQKNLQAFYNDAVKTIQSKGKDAMMKALKKDEDWDLSMQKERNSEAYRKGSREVLNKTEESDFNLKHLSKQLGTTLGFTLSSATFSGTNSTGFPKTNSSSTAGFAPYKPTKYNLPIVVNIDRLTPELLSAKESMTVNRMDKSKSAQLVYTPFNVHVASSKNYDHLFFYLMPDELNSFERLDFTSGILNTKLNEEMKYRGTIVGMNEKGYFLYPINAVKPGNLGTVQLVAVSEKEFNKRVNELNAGRNSNALDMQSELNWLFKEKANYTVQKQRKKDAEFRAVVRPTIYSCGTRGVSIQDIPKPSQEGFSAKTVSITAPLTPIMEVVEQNAEFPGGREALMSFLRANIKIPDLADAINGKVYLKFVVSETGKITNVTVKKNLPGCPECDAEAKRVVEMMPDWVPAKNDGKAVNTWYTFPIIFSTQ